MDVYAENILEHYRSPRNTGSGNGASIMGKEDNPSCGDELTVHLWIEAGVIAKVEWEGNGCAISQAAMSMLSEEIEGLNVEDVLKMKKDDVYDMLGVPVGPRRFKCALLCLHTLKNAILELKGKQKQSWVKTVEIS